MCLVLLTTISKNMYIFQNKEFVSNYFLEYSIGKNIFGKEMMNSVGVEGAQCQNVNICIFSFKPKNILAKAPIFKCQKMALRAPKSKNGVKIKAKF